MDGDQKQLIKMGALSTRKGTIPLPCFFPVSTYGDRYPLDRLIRPYLGRLCPAYLVSYHYASDLDRDASQAIDIPLFIDSGGFSLLLDGYEMIEQYGSWGIGRKDGTGDPVTRQGVLERQMRHAEIGATLDFPIPPSCEDPDERQRRFDATLENAAWALANNRRSDLLLFASLQCWSAESALTAAQSYAEMSHCGKGFSGIAIGGLVPRLRDEAYVESIIRAVRNAWDGPIHVFGVGSPRMIRQCMEWGATSTDSSSYIKYAANGQSLAGGPALSQDTVTPLDRMSLALRNLAYTVDPAAASFPLNAVSFLRPFSPVATGQCTISAE